MYGDYVWSRREQRKKTHKKYGQGERKKEYKRGQWHLYEYIPTKII